MQLQLAKCHVSISFESACLFVCRMCRFRNLCYLPEPALYVFFHHNTRTIQSGVPEDRHSPALCDLSTVRNHNRQLFNYVDVPAESASKVFAGDKAAILISHTSLVMKRFNPDNLMHVLHDDLLPLYYTLMMHGLKNDKDGKFDVQLVLMEGWDPGAYIDLYQLFTSYKPLFLQDIVKAGQPVCFQDLHVGLSKHTTWYQYGFHEPQGPIPDSSVTAIEIRQFTEFIRRRLNTENQDSTVKTPEGDRYKTKEHSNVKSEHLESNTIVIFTRRYNRLILNEVELTAALAQRLQMKVITLSIETHTIQHILSVLARTTVLISMHGSLLSFSMFLPPGTILIELFPYAINPNNYTPYKTLAELPGMGILHQAWQNKQLENAVSHPTRSWDEGGIAHLPPDEQKRILDSTEVPLHFCCSNPEWLFRIYQDTIVDINAVVALVRSQLLEQDIRMSSLIEEQHANVCDRIFPSWVQNLTCTEASDADPKLLIKWKAPWNIEFLDSEKIEYEVWLQQSGHADYLAYTMTKTGHLFDTDLSKGTEYYVWVRCLLDSDIIGSFNAEQVACVP